MTLCTKQRKNDFIKKHKTKMTTINKRAKRSLHWLFALCSIKRMTAVFTNFTLFCLCVRNTCKIKSYSEQKIFSAICLEKKHLNHFWFCLYFVSLGFFVSFQLYNNNSSNNKVKSIKNYNFFLEINYYHVWVRLNNRCGLGRGEWAIWFGVTRTHIIGVSDIYQP